MSKSSANPRKYSLGKDAIDVTQPLFVYIELRMEKQDLLTLSDRLTYLQSRRPQSSVSPVGVRRETSKLIVTIGLDMGPVGEALKSQHPQMLDGYDLMFDIMHDLVEYAPVLTSAPGVAERAAAEALGLTAEPKTADSSADLPLAQ